MEKVENILKNLKKVENLEEVVKNVRIWRRFDPFAHDLTRFYTFGAVCAGFGPFTNKLRKMYPLQKTVTIHTVTDATNVYRK